MRKHPVYSEQILREMGEIPEEAIVIAVQHHEKCDGSGYPYQLKNGQIHTFGMMAAIADVYDALTSARSYKPAFPPHAALGTIFSGKGNEFKSEMVDQFVKNLSIYPVGSLVRLSDGKIALVIKTNPRDSLRPKVALIDTSQRSRGGLSVVDLAVAQTRRSITNVLDPQQLEIDVNSYLEDLS